MNTDLIYDEGTVATSDGGNIVGTGALWGGAEDLILAGDTIHVNTAGTTWVERKVAADVLTPFTSIVPYPAWSDGTLSGKTYFIEKNSPRRAEAFSALASVNALLARLAPVQTALNFNGDDRVLVLDKVGAGDDAGVEFLSGGAQKRRIGLFGSDLWKDQFWSGAAWIEHGAPNARPGGETAYTIVETDKGRAVIGTNNSAAMSWTLGAPGDYSDAFCFTAKNDSQYPLQIAPTGCGIGTNSGIVSYVLTLAPNQAARIFSDGTNWQYHLGVAGQSNAVGGAVYALGYGGHTPETFVTLSGTPTNGDIVGFNYISTTPAFNVPFRHTINAADPDPFKAAVIDLANQFRNNATVQSALTKDVAAEAYYLQNSAGQWSMYFNQYWPLLIASTITTTPFASGGATAVVTVSPGGTVLGNGSGVIMGRSGALFGKTPEAGDGLTGIFVLGDTLEGPMPTRTNIPDYGRIIWSILDPDEASLASLMGVLTGTHHNGRMLFDTGRFDIDAPKLLTGAGSTNITNPAVVHHLATNVNAAFSGPVVGTGHLGAGMCLSAVNDANDNLVPLEIIASQLHLYFSVLTGANGVAVQGTLTNDNAPAGYVGEYITGNRSSGSALALTTLTAVDIATITLGPGDWDVRGFLIFLPAATTNTVQVISSLSETLNTLDSSDDRMGLVTFGSAGAVTGSGNSVRAPVGQSRFSVAAATTKTVRLVAFAQFTVSTMTAYGTIRARRVR